MFRTSKGLKAKSTHLLVDCFLGSWPDFIAFVSGVVYLKEAINRFGLHNILNEVCGLISLAKMVRNIIVFDS